MLRRQRTKEPDDFKQHLLQRHRGAFLFGGNQLGLVPEGLSHLARVGRETGWRLRDLPPGIQMPAVPKQHRDCLEGTLMVSVILGLAERDLIEYLAHLVA